MKLLIIDSHCLGHIAKHTMKGLVYGTFETGVIYGFLKILLDIMLRYPEHVPIFCWDSRKNKRKNLFSNYKVRHTDAIKSDEEKYIDDSTHRQFGDLRVEILPEIGFLNNFIKTGYESDDIIASVVIKQNNPENIVVSNDEDLYQLLDCCSMVNPRDKSVMTKNQFVETYRIMPKTWASVKSIAGCDSDKVPGVPNVGEKRAIKYLLNELKTSSMAYLSIRHNWHTVIFNEPLVTLPFPGVGDFDIVPNRHSKDGFLFICNRYGFKSFLDASTYNDWMVALKLV